MNKTDTNIAFGHRLCQLRKQYGFTQETLAFKCGFDRTYIGIIERGEKSPTINTVARIAEVFGITLKELFDYD